MHTCARSRLSRGRAVYVLSLLGCLLTLIITVAPNAHSAGAPPPTLDFIIAIDGDVAVVGAPWANDFAGAAYVLRRDGMSWVIDQTLAPADLGRYDHFGGAVAIDGNTIVVTTTWQNLFRGAAYVYERRGGSWVQQHKLAARDAQPDEQLGTSASIAGDAITVGSAAGVARRFERNGDAWRELNERTQAGDAQSAPASASEDASIRSALADSGVDGPPAAPAAPPDSVATVSATDGLPEDRVDVTWESVGLDAIVYVIRRDTDLISVASSDDISYSDPDVDIDHVAYYCVTVKDMLGQESAPTCDYGHRSILRPTAVQASDGLYTNRVAISWIDMSNINDGYYIKRDGMTIDTTGPDARSVSDSAATPETVHTYQVIAFVNGGFESLPASDTGWMGAILPPLNVSASDGDYSDRVAVTWTDQSDDETGYRVYRDGALIHTTAADVESFVDSLVAFGLTYEYCVAAIDAVTESARGCDEGGTGLTPPGNVMASDSTYDDRVEITWEDRSDFENGYEISRSIVTAIVTGHGKPGLNREIELAPATGDVVVGTTASNVESFSDFTAEPDVAYTYYVRAITDNGGRSNSVSDDGYRAIVLAPYDVLATEGEYEDRTDISWSSNSTTAVLFKILRDGVLIKSVSSAARSHADRLGTAGQSYSYEVVAVTALEAEASSGPFTGRRELRPPQDVTATDAEFEDRIVISWTDASDVEDGYHVYRRDTTETDSTLVKTLSANQTLFTDYGAGSSTGPSDEQIVYRYSVAAFDDASGTEGESNVDADLGHRTLRAPTGVQASDDAYEDRVVITWQDNSYAEDGYGILRLNGSSGPVNFTVDDNVTSFVDTAPELGVSHLYIVHAFDGSGVTGASQDYGSCTFLPPGSFIASDIYQDRVELTWFDESDLEGAYLILRDGVEIGTTNDDATTFTDTPPSQGTAYQYSMRSLISRDVTVSQQGFYDTPGEANKIVMVGDYAYVADGSAGLQIIDFSNPASPFLVGSFNTTGEAWDLKIQGNYAYIADGSAGLRCVNISNPSAPADGGGLDTPGTAYGVILSPPFYAYIADGSAGLRKLWALPPTMFQDEYGTVTPGTAYALSRGGPGDDIRVADGASGIRSYRDGYGFSETDSYDTPGTARDITVVGSSYNGDLYVADGSEGLQVLSAYNLSYQWSYDTPGEVYSAAKDGYNIYIADGDNGVLVLDATIPDSPVPVGSYNTPGSARNILVHNGNIVVGDATGGLRVLSTSRDGMMSAEVYDSGMRAPRPTAETVELLVALAPNDLVYGDQFHKVAVSGNTAILGSWGDDSSRGAVYVFVKDGDGNWQQTQKLVGSNTEAGGIFGASIAMSGNLAIVGGPLDDGATNADQGGAWIYERDDNGWWSEVKGIYASDRQAGDRFGTSVAIEGDYAIVGAPEEDANGSNSGAVYVFQRSGGVWPTTQTAKIGAGDGDTSDQFGKSVAINNGVMVVGAYRESALGTSAGAAYVFTGSGASWTQDQKLLPDDLGASDEFGTSVAVYGQYIVIGAPHPNGLGSAYVFHDDGSTWTQTQKLVPSDQDDSEQFGCDVAISGDVAIIGAQNDDHIEDNRGSAYLFIAEEDGAWRQMQKLVAGDAERCCEYFGASVGISGNVAMSGGFWAGPIGSGAVYVLELTKSPGAVAATDGTLSGVVRVTWDDRSLNEHGFRIYRDGLPLSSVEPNVQVFEDFDAEPGRTYEYSVSSFISALSDDMERIGDFGWRPANGSITGSVTTVGGASVSDIHLLVDPLETHALVFDGSGGYVNVPDEDGLLNFTVSQSFTIEAWIRYEGGGGTGAGDATLIARAAPGSEVASWPFLIHNKRGSLQPGRLAFSICDGTTALSAVTDGSNYNDDAWHHVACVHDAATGDMLLYVDGTLDGTGSSSGLGNITNTETVSLGVGRVTGSWYEGRLDEVRVWSAARTEAEINSTKDRPLTGKETGLIAYWPLDRAHESAVTDRTTGNHYGAMHGGVYWHDDAAPMDYYPITGSNGEFVLNDLRYEGQTTFKVTPSEGGRQFEPPFKMITLTTEDPVENQVNFIDVSAFDVTGTVRFAGTECGVESATILVDDEEAGTTDKNGRFTVTADLGNRVIKASLGNHTFSPDSIALEVLGDVELDDTTSVAFEDLTKYTLSGRLGGGCDPAIGIGDITVTIRSENNCLLYTITSDSAYSVELPPQNYLVSATVDDETIPLGLDKLDVMQFFQNLGQRLVQMDSTDVQLDFIYRAPLRVAVEDFTSFIPACGEPLTFDNRILPANLPVIPQGTHLVLQIKVDEDYGTAGLCALDTGVVTIYDELFDRDDEPLELIISNGVAVCSTYTSTPNLVVGRVDSQGNDRSFQKSFTAVVDIDGRDPVTVTEWVLVTGHVAPEGADFVTMTSEPMPLYILRDPPGDGSYAFLEESYAFTNVINFFMETWTADSDGEVFEGKAGFNTDWFVGLGGGKEFEWAVMLEGRLNTKWYRLGDTASTTRLTTEVTERLATAGTNLFVGEEGDVFIGAGLNFTFSEVGVVEVENCEVVLSQSVGMEPEGFATTFVYSHQYITDVLIPEFDSKVAYYDSIDEPDSSVLFQHMGDDWRYMLAKNDTLKAESLLLENLSFSAGAEYAYTYSSGTTWEYRETMTMYRETEDDLGIYFKLFGQEFSWLDMDYDQSSNVEELTDNSTTNVTTVGYHLSDGDIGDHFTVDVKNDGRYLSPVFDVLAGVSSCPYEPWPAPLDTTEAPRMVARDKPEIYISPVRRDNVPADEAAAFTLTVANKSPNNEARRIVVRVVNASNPYGAIIEVGDYPIAHGLEYFIEPNTSQEVTLTVRRGPNRYNYEDLKMFVYAPCEYELWEEDGFLQLADTTAAFTVTFEAPCSDVALYLPEPGWTYTAADEVAANPLDLWITDYEFQISEDDTVISVGAQYRRAGDNDNGPGEWVDILADSLGETHTIIEWEPADSLSDGAYELRAYTDCEKGRGYSAVAAGTIDRNGPLALGTPEPSDGELSFGENIRITFNEFINCESVDTTLVTLKYVDGLTPGALIPIDRVCGGASIVLVPLADVNNLEGRRLEASVAGVTDVGGNAMPEAVTWQFDYRASLFTWADVNLSADVAYRNPGTVTADLVNGTDEMLDFDIIYAPPWIAGITPDVGAMLPGTIQTLEFEILGTIDLGLNQDEVHVRAVGSDTSVAVLNVNLHVSCQAPEWAVNPADFEHSMNVVALLDIEGVNSTNTDDRVAAFVGNELRGVANVEAVVGLPNSHLAFLTVYSNRSVGETVRFEVWAADSCMHYNATEEQHAFVANDVIGSPNNPVTLTASDVPGGNLLEIAVGEGWTWISTNIRSADMNANAVLSSLTPGPGDVLKSQSAFTQFVDNTTGWTPALVLDNVSSYMVRLSEAGTIVHSGATVPVDSVISVTQGWNWIGYLPEGPIATATALGDLHAQGILSADDLIKSQSAFAQYYGGAWYGSLAYMEPGYGYKLYLDGPGSHTFNYPFFVAAAAAPVVASTAPDEAAAVEGAPAWSVNPHRYQFNMTLTGVVVVDGDESGDSRDIVGAFVGDECRGVTQPVYIDGVRRHITFLMVHLDDVDDERVDVRVFDASAFATYDAANPILCKADDVRGSVIDPVKLTVNSGGGSSGDLPTVFALRQNVPNPFNPATTIHYDVPAGGGPVTLHIYDVRGRLVHTLVDGFESAGHKAVTWNGRGGNGQQIATGVYFYRMTAPGFLQTRKMVLLK